MPTTPILAIEQVSASQNQKEVTINSAIEALENATNRKLTVSFAAGATVTLSDAQTTRNFLFEATAASAAATLRLPNTVNGQNLNRIFAVRNASGQSLTVRFTTGAGTTVVIPDGETRLLAATDGLDVRVAAEPPTVATFLSLTDTPLSYATFGGKFLAVNATEDAIEFIDAAVFPDYIGNLGKVLAVNATEDGVEWVDIATSFTALTDAPASYTGQANKVLAVKNTEDGLEFIDVPEAEAVEYVASDQWRIRVVLGGTDNQVGFAEVQFLDQDYLNIATGGVADASSFDVSYEPENAFDSVLTSGTGWLSEADDTIDATIGYTFAAPVYARYVKLWPFEPLTAEFTPTRFVIERWNGSAWVAAGDRTPATWVGGEPQTFKVNGVPLSSVSDAPIDGNTYGRENGAWVNIAERIRDVVGATLVAGTNITIAVNDAGDEITINASGSSYGDEQARDAIAAALVEVAGIDIVYDDVAETITFTVDLTEIEASSSEMWVGTSSSKAVTPKKIFDAAVTQDLVDGATITIDGNAGFNFRVTLAGNRTLANPTNMKTGQSGVIIVTQDATGGRTLTYGSNWRFPGGAASGGVLSTAANAVDVISYYVRSDGTILANIGKDYKA